MGIHNIPDLLRHVPPFIRGAALVVAIGASYLLGGHTILVSTSKLPDDVTLQSLIQALEDKLEETNVDSDIYVVPLDTNR